MTITETSDARAELASRYSRVRNRTERLASELAPEDQVVQSMPDASPTKWHRAHTTWFFETFVLERFAHDYAELDRAYAYLFNSYYEAAGPRHTRAERGMITRPGVDEVTSYRRHVDDAIMAMLSMPIDDRAEELIELGLHHEEQHQELLLMDIKHLFSLNPSFPAYIQSEADTVAMVPPAPTWRRFDGGIVALGHDGDGFGFDNELPRHDVLVRPFELSDRLVTCGEWLDFMNDGGYSNPSNWLSDGWHTAGELGWRAPEYWHLVDGQWFVFTLHGLRPVNPHEPVCHLSYYEADAFAAWSGARLPTEAEWEHAAMSLSAGPGADRTGSYHPTVGGDDDGELDQMFDQVWQWTASPYTPYPGFEAAPGAVGEYNGKFMVNTLVMRGGCCVTPPGHVRASYRNFFHPSTRWHFSGLRVARNV